MADSGGLVQLVQTDMGLGLTSERFRQQGSQPLVLDFHHPRLQRRLRAGWRHEALLRAIGCRPGQRPAVADLTAGQGTDALLMAHAGCRVWLSESDPKVHALLADVMERSAASALAPVIERMTLMPPGDSFARLDTLGREATVAYIDPMFEKPARGASDKSMLLLAEAVGVTPAEHVERLLAAARGRFRRVVVKRRRRAAPVEDPVHHTVSGRSVAFDVYLNGKIGENSGKV